MVKLEILRGNGKKTLYIPAIEHRDHMDELLDAVNPENSLIPRLGVLAIDLTPTCAPAWARCCEFRLEWSSSAAPPT